MPALYRPGAVVEAALPLTKPGEFIARPAHVGEDPGSPTFEGFDFAGEAPDNAAAAAPPTTDVAMPQFEGFDFADEKPENAAVAPTADEPPGALDFFGESWENIKGVADLAAVMVTGLPAMVTGLTAATGAAVWEMDPKAFSKGLEVGSKSLSGIVWAPRSERGTKIVEGVGRVFHGYSEGVDWVSERMPRGLFIGDEERPETQDQILGTAAKITGELGLFALGPKVKPKAPVKPKADKTPEPSIPDAAATAGVPDGQPMPAGQGKGKPRTQYFKEEDMGPAPVADEAALKSLSPNAQANAEAAVKMQLDMGAPPVSIATRLPGIPAGAGQVLVDRALKRAGQDKASTLSAREIAAHNDAGLPLPGETAVVVPTGKLNPMNGPPHEHVGPQLDLAKENLVAAATKGAEQEAVAGAAADALGVAKPAQIRVADQLRQLYNLPESRKPGEKPVPKAAPAEPVVGEKVVQFLEEESGMFGPRPPKPPGVGTITEETLAGQARVAATEPKTTKMRAWDFLQSPKVIANRLRPLRKYTDAGGAATQAQKRLQSAFSRRLTAIEHALASPVQRLRTGGQMLRENKATMNDLLVQGDLAGRAFTRAELVTSKVSKEVIDGYMMTRSAIDHAWKMLHDYRKSQGLETGKLGGYVPHTFHEYFVRGRDPAGAMTDLASYKTLREARDAAEALVAKGQDVSIAPKMNRFEGAANDAAMVGDMSYFRLRNNVEDVFSLSRDEATSMLSDVARPRAKGRRLGHLMERKGAAGWEQNMDHALRTYFNQVSRYLAVDPFKRQSLRAFEKDFGAFGDDAAGLRKYVKNYINDVNGVPPALDAWINQGIMSNKLLGPIVESYLGPNAVQQIARGTTKSVAVLKLGMFNVSAALVNGSQLLLANSVLGPRWLGEGVAAASKKSAQDRGILRQIGVEYGAERMFEVAPGTGMGKIGKGFERTLAMFSGMEYFLRSATTLGAYKRAKSGGQSHKDALEYARATNDRVNFNYDLADAPDLFRRTGSIGSVLLQFKKFPIKSVEFLRTLDGAEHARFWLPYFAASGLTGTPFGPAFSRLAESVTGVNPELEAKGAAMSWAGADPERKELVEAALWGVPAAAGADLSSRIRLGDLFPERSLDLAGPTLGTIYNAARNARQEGWLEALRSISPGVANPLAAITNDGIITRPWDRDRIVRELSPRGRVLKGVGISPTEETIEREVTRIMKYERGANQKEKGRAITDWVRAMRVGDEAREEAALERYIELGGKKRALLEEMKKQEMTQTERAFKQSPKALRGEQQPMLEFAQ